MDAVNPMTEFKAEFSYIEGELHKEIFLRAMQFIPEYFWVIPASTSGRYHPKTSLGVGGLLRHTKSAFRVAQELLAHPLYREMFTQEERDEIRIAICLHDACKQGTDNKAEGYAEDHPILVGEQLCPWKDGADIPDGMEEAWNNITKLIDTHMGPWNVTKSGTKFAEPPKTNLQLFVHMCDYLSSRRGIEMEGLDEYKPDWREGPASQAQVTYLESLVSRCVSRKIPVPISTDFYGEDGSISLKKGAASSAIGQLKECLGEK